MTEEQREAIKLLIKDAEGLARRAFSKYNRKTRRYDFSDQVWKDRRPAQFRAVQIVREMIA